MAESSPTSAVPLLRGLLADAESVADLRPRHALILPEFCDAPPNLGLHIGESGAEVQEVLGSRGGISAVEAGPGETGGVGHASTIVDSERESIDIDELASLDGKHHLWCKACHPEWVARPLGAELAVPFVAVCGQRAVLLARWPSDELNIPGVCAICADPTTPCSTCGSL